MECVKAVSLHELLTKCQDISEPDVLAKQRTLPELCFSLLSVEDELSCFNSTIKHIITFKHEYNKTHPKSPWVVSQQYLLLCN